MHAGGELAGKADGDLDRTGWQPVRGGQRDGLLLGLVGDGGRLRGRLSGLADRHRGVAQGELARVKDDGLGGLPQLQLHPNLTDEVGA